MNTSQLQEERMAKTRVVVTGLGATTPIGGDVASTWEALLAGRSGAKRLTADWVAELPVQIAAPAAVEPTEIIERVKARRLDRNAQFAVVAAREAWADAGLADAEIDKERLGVALASGIGGLATTLANYDALKTNPRRVSPLAIPMLMPNSAAANVSLELGARAGVGLRLRQRGDRARRRPDPARPRRHHGGGRCGGRDLGAAAGRVQPDDGAQQAQRRPGAGVPAVGRRPRRVPARRGRRGAGDRVRRARPGPWRQGVRRGRERGYDRRRPRHRAAGAARRRRQPGDQTRAAGG